MKTLFKLVIALLLLNAVARGAWATWNYYQLRDTAQQLVMFGQKATSNQLRDEILAKAKELNVPVMVGDVNVQRDGMRTVARGAYTQPVEFFPNYAYPIKFTFLVDAVSLGGLPPPADQP
ncbi:MAG TPA: hypothetical protein VI485_15605 [Vicinamibacterales bacterium]|nr:hypothetical protein [Vicinamibacterales bacterium]